LYPVAGLFRRAPERSVGAAMGGSGFLDTNNGPSVPAAMRRTRPREVDFNPKPKTHLQETAKRRASDAQWLFRSPQRGEKVIHAQTFGESLGKSTEKAGLPRIGFDDPRHYFICYRVMNVPSRAKSNCYPMAARKGIRCAKSNVTRWLMCFLVNCSLRSVSFEK
jgi:hypothetical protein